MFSCKICEMFKNTYFEEQLWMAASRQAYHSRVKSARVPVLWFRVSSKCFQFWSKTHTKHYTNINYLLPHDETIFLLKFIKFIHVFHFRIFFGKTLVAFDLWKTYKKCYTNNYIHISPSHTYRLIMSVIHYWIKM